MRLPRETTAARVRRACVTVLALSASLSMTAVVPTALRRAADTNRARTAETPAGRQAGIAISHALGAAPGAPTSDPVAPAPEPPADSEALPSRSTEPAPFTIDLPPEWQGGESLVFPDDAARSFEYADAQGRYFVVNLDPAGSEFEADEVWRYSVRNGDRFHVKTARRCTPGEAMCPAGDQQFLGYAVWIEGGSAMVGGHAYYFRFGDRSREDGDTDIFRTLLESIRVLR